MAVPKRTTRQHRSGNSFSVRLPRDLAYDKPDQELEIEKNGDELVLRPKVTERLTIEEFIAWVRATGGVQLGPEASVRGAGRPTLWDAD